MADDDPFQKTDTLDEVLLDVAALIELSRRDRDTVDEHTRGDEQRRHVWCWMVDTGLRSRKAERSQE